MIYLGLDPGTKDNMVLAALLPDDLRVATIDCGKDGDARSRTIVAAPAARGAIKALTLPEDAALLVVEWQRPLPGDKRPKNISDLSAFAGLAMGAIQGCFSNLTVFTPTPDEWKGQVPKHIKHNRIVALAGLDRVRFALERAGIPVPASLGRFAREFSGKASNAIDAIGLALWGKQQDSSLSRYIRQCKLPVHDRSRSSKVGP